MEALAARALYVLKAHVNIAFIVLLITVVASIVRAVVNVLSRDGPISNAELEKCSRCPNEMLFSERTPFEDVLDIAPGWTCPRCGEKRRASNRCPKCQSHKVTLVSQGFTLHAVIVRCADCGTVSTVGVDEPTEPSN